MDEGRTATGAAYVCGPDVSKNCMKDIMKEGRTAYGAAFRCSGNVVK
tara:strand:+ start:3616 stop:3756 length:141 start_codon:yes stop_codon:yes gene_type:complete